MRWWSCALVFWAIVLHTAVAQVVGAGYVDQQSVYSGYLYDYNAATGNCTTNDPNGCDNNIGATFLPGNTASQNATFLSDFNTEGQKHFGEGPTGSGSPYTNASVNNCIELDIPAGTYTYSASSVVATEYFSCAIIKGAGSNLVKITNTASTGGVIGESEWQTGGDYFRSITTNNYGYFINTSAAGATSVTTTTAANAGNFTVGRWVLIWDYEQQYTGTSCGTSSYPPNARYYDLAIVTSTNASTGVIGLDRPLYFAHSSSNPYAGTLTDGTTGTCGPARITAIDSTAYPVARWYQISGISFGANPNWNAGTQATSDGVQYTGIIDGQATDIVATYINNTVQVRNFVNNASVWTFDETDKIVNNLRWNAPFVGNLTSASSGTYNHSGELYVEVDGGRISNQPCCAGEISLAQQQFVANNVYFNGYAVSTFGGGPDLNDNEPTGGGVTLNGIVFVGIGSGTNAPLITAPAPNQSGSGCQSGNTCNGGYITVDGTTTQVVTGPNGASTRLQITKALGTFGSPSQTVNDNWGVGSNFEEWKNAAFVSGCYPTAITGDASNVYVDFVSGCTFATNDHVWVAKAPFVTVMNSNGLHTGLSAASWLAPTLSSDTAAIHYPNGTPAIPSITWTNNSGN